MRSHENDCIYPDTSLQIGALQKGKKFYKNAIKLIEGKYKKYVVPKDASWFEKDSSYFGGYNAKFLLNNGLEKLFKLYVECRKRKKILCVELSLRGKDLFGKTLGHANMLIFNYKTFTLERYEPHGEKTGFGFDSDYVDKVLEKLALFFRDMGQIIKYIPPNLTCPLFKGKKKGFQELEAQNKIDERVRINLLNALKFEKVGYCVMWSMFIMDLRLRFPEVKPVKLFSTALESINDKGGDSLNRFIRGFTNRFVDDLRETFEGYDEELLKDIKTISKADNAKLLKRVNKLLNIKDQTEEPEISKIQSKLEKMLKDIKRK